MISYKKQKYNDIREAMPDDVFVQLMQGTLKANKIDADEETSRRILLSLLTSMAYYLFKEPIYYVDFKKMVLYRDIKLSNLLVLEAKEGESADTIMKYYKNGGAYSEELERLVRSFIEGLLTHSTQKQAEIAEEINRIKNAQKSKSNNSKSKEKK